MITSAFSTASEPIITQASCYGPKKHLADVGVVTFSWMIYQDVLKNYDCEIVAEMRAANGVKPIHCFAHQGKRVAFYLSSLGSALAATEVLDCNWLTGAEKFVVFGSAGCLDREIAAGKYIIPTAAYRDEGMSYHYAPPADYISMPGAETTAAIFREAGIPHILGKVWTTDAFFRELRHQMEARKREGCLAVDMEAAGIQAVCDFHHISLYYFLMTGDVLDAPEWEGSGLHRANHDLNHFDAALRMAERI